MAIDLNLFVLLALFASLLLVAVIFMLRHALTQINQLNLQIKAQSDTHLLIQERLQLNQGIAQKQLEFQAKFSSSLQQTIGQLRLSLQEQLNSHKEQFNHNQITAINQLVEHLNKSTKQSRQELSLSLKDNAEVLAKRMGELTESTDKRLQDISAGVERRLTDGFDKTTKTFNDILKRLALIDDAQKKITELSTNVVSLQEVLADKRSRGAFGEVQLNALIRNVLPEKHFSIQHTLSNGKIADCILFLPKPTGNVVIDSKFPLESYKRMTNIEIGVSDKKLAERQFKQDIKKHINDISDKYLIDNETADGAVMFIPAEAIFAEIHAHYPELVEQAYKKRVWLASPTTLMAILTTARSVLKDEATRKQIHVIQEHLSLLGADFGRFRSRFDNLAKHIDQAASDVKLIHTSANKISGRFEKIEQVDLAEDELIPEVN
ncbi:recombinase RmuC [Thalassotalea sp. 42_200_T64]|nr:recombinase RmuC [Thalassotalea sp. 42_200_T64]